MGAWGQRLPYIPGFNTPNLCPQPNRFRPWFRGEKLLSLCANNGPQCYLTEQPLAAELVPDADSEQYLATRAPSRFRKCGK